MARFDNKVVLISGGARGQGAAEARLFHERVALEPIRYWPSHAMSISC